MAVLDPVGPAGGLISAGMERRRSPTCYSVQPAEPDSAAAQHALVDAVRRAVLDYDETSGEDHLRHPPGADCVRCRVASAVWADGGPSPPRGGPS